MTDLSICEAYFLFAAGEKGRIFGYDNAKVSCLLTAALFELAREGSVTLAADRIYLSKCKPDTSYLLPLHEHFGQLDELTYREIYSVYASSISEWNLNSFTTPLGTSLASKGYVTRAKVGFIGGRTYFVPHKNAIPSAAAEYSVDLLCQTVPCTEHSLLWFLLEQSGCIPAFFTDEQRADIHRKVETAISDNADLRQLTDCAGKLLAFVKRGKLTVEYH